jgi:hypothetical protein
VGERGVSGADEAYAAYWGDALDIELAFQAEEVKEQETGADRRREILREVERCVCRDRQNTYGDAEDNFADIAALINVVLAPKLKEPLAAHDVATISACIKLARIKSSPGHLDNWIDLAGYAVCGGGIIKRG